MSIQKITIVGTGAVGAALARNCVRHGIEVQIAGRDSSKTGALAATLGDKARAVATRSLGDGVEALFLAVPAGAAEAVLDEASGLASGTIVVDCTNPLKWVDGPVHAPPPEGSMTAHLAARFPRLRLVKAFNTFGAEFHERPELGTTAADVYLAGDDAQARQSIGALARTLGFEGIDVGPLRNAQHLESLAILWIHLATVGKRGRDAAFKLLSR